MCLMSTQIVDLYYTRTDTANSLNQKVSTSGNSAVQGDLSAWVFRCCDLIVKQQRRRLQLPKIDTTPTE